MKKSIVEKRLKFTTNTYMREALLYDINIIKEEDLFVTIKHYKKVSGKFSVKDENGNLVDYIDEGYYMIELTPLKENYNIRYYIDRNKKIIDYYIDITLKNGVRNCIPYYVDLYLDIIHYPKSDICKFCDEEELEDALKNKLISKNDYNFAYKVGNKLFKEIINKTNKYMNMDILKYLHN